MTMNPITCSISWECFGNVFAFQLFMNFIRYFPLAVGLFLVIWVWKKGTFQRFRIQQSFPKLGRVAYEARWSAVTLFIFAAMATGSVWLGKLGYTKVYLEPLKYGVPYLFVSFVLLTIWHETWFYWAHRVMHSKLLFKHVHAVHHRSTNPSPIAAYSFHPWEAVLEAIYLPIFVLFVPIAFPVILVQLFYTMVLNIWWHLGYEFLPKGWAGGRLTRWLNTSTHHNMHHSHVHGNYSLYFNFWDRVMGTNFPSYESYYRTVRARAEQGGGSREDLTDHRQGDSGLGPAAGSA